MSDSQRVLTFPNTITETYTDRLEAAMARVVAAQAVLTAERKALERLLLTEEPEGRTH